jgi:uncharacterized protein (DUF2235 family)
VKRLIVCADGTWNEPSTKDGGKACPTNVVRLAQTIAPSAAGVAQVVYYHDGVGTHPGVDRWLGGVFGIGLDRIVCDIYRFLVQNFESGDELYLFGFSRGAFTARSVAGMIRKCGILKKRQVDEVADAFDFYRRADVKPADPPAVEWRRTRSRTTRIKCIGVWDTVGSLGIPVTFLRWIAAKRFAFHDVDLSSSVDNAFHALAIDEQRKAFLPTIWNVQPPDPAFPQRVEQVWFAGVHSDVGGGYTETDLSDITLKWMIDRASSCGLVIDTTIADGLVGDPCGPLHDSMTSYYKLLGDGTRHIDDPAPAGTYPATLEVVSPAALARYDAWCANRGPRYSPWPLVDYLMRTGLRRIC